MQHTQLLLYTRILLYSLVNICVYFVHMFLILYTVHCVLSLFMFSHESSLIFSKRYAAPTAAQNIHIYTHTIQTHTYLIYNISSTQHTSFSPMHACSQLGFFVHMCVCVLRSFSFSLTSNPRSKFSFLSL